VEERCECIHFKAENVVSEIRSSDFEPEDEKMDGGCSTACSVLLKSKSSLIQSNKLSIYLWLAPKTPSTKTFPMPGISPQVLAAAPRG
jgi:hypothetical protein